MSGCINVLSISVIVSVPFLALYPALRAGIEYPIWGIIMLAVILFLVIAVFKRRYKIHRIMKVRPERRYRDNDIKWAKQMFHFLSQNKGFYSNKTGTYIKDTDDDVVDLIRIADRLGCEVVVRKVTDHDTEDEKYTPELFRAIINRMKEKSYAR